MKADFIDSFPATMNELFTGAKLPQAQTVPERAAALFATAHIRELADMAADGARFTLNDCEKSGERALVGALRQLRYDWGFVPVKGTAAGNSLELRFAGDYLRVVFENEKAVSFNAVCELLK